jgi:hypothetical protein
MSELIEIPVEQAIEDIKLARRYLNTAQSAQDRKHEFTLTFNDFKKCLARTHCPYSGVLMNSEDGNPHQKTIDRIDASKGYIAGNVIACAKFINVKKVNLTTDEIKAIYKVIVKRGL